MHVTVLQHVPFEWIGSMEPWLRERGASITTIRLWEERTLPTPEVSDLIVVMGGPMSVNDEAAHPWLVAEKAFLREVIAAGVPMLGVCLGAQLIASALGAWVGSNPQKEIGWFPIRATQPGSEGAASKIFDGASRFAFPASVEVFHWHGETFDLPPGAVRLAESAACENQAFQLGQHVIGMQFHLETTPDTADDLIEHCGDELVPGPYIQTAVAMRATPAASYAAINTLCGEVLAYVLGER